MPGESRRVRLVAVRVTHGPGGTGRVDVELERLDGATVRGTADVEPSATGALKAAAGAALHALALATATAHGFGVGGVKSVRAFDETIVLVQLARAVGPGPLRLVGAAGVDPAGADQAQVRAAVLAVLSATNRVLSVGRGGA